MDESSSEPAEAEPRQVKLADQIPAEWGFREGRTDLWVSCYRVYMVERAELIRPQTKQIEAHGCWLTYFFGEPRYYHPGTFDIGPWDGVNPVQIVSQGMERRSAPTGAYLLIATPYPKEAAPEDEPTTRRRIKALVGLIRATLGRNAAFDLLFENIWHSDGKMTAASAGVALPLSFPLPRLAHDNLQNIREMSARISKDEHMANRINLALGWLDDGIARSGVDSLLALWIALETLAMPNTTDVKPVVESLSRAYRISYPEARDRFLVGRLAGLRGEIVHRGRQLNVSKVLRYLQAVFADVLRENLGIETTREAQVVLDEMTRAGTSLAQVIAEAEASE